MMRALHSSDTMWPLCNHENKKRARRREKTGDRKTTELFPFSLCLCIAAITVISHFLRTLLTIHTITQPHTHTHTQHSALFNIMLVHPPYTHTSPPQPPQPTCFILFLYDYTVMFPIPSMSSSLFFILLCFSLCCHLFPFDALLL